MAARKTLSSVSRGSSPSISSVFLRSSSGYDWRITSWSESSGETRCTSQLDKQEILTQPPLAEVQTNEERQGNLNIRCLEIKKELVSKGGSKAIFKNLQSLRKIQYWTSGSIFVSRSNRILDWHSERYWQICQRSHADPRGRESFGETRRKSETNIKTVINKWLGLYSYWTETTDWHWNIGIQCSLLFSSVKIHHSITSTQSKSLSRSWRSSPLWPSFCDHKKKQPDNTEYWSDEMNVNAPHRSMEKWISVLAKGGGQKNRFHYCLNPNYLHQFLHLRAIQGHSGSTINPPLQDTVLIPEGFTEFVCVYIYICI